MFNPIKYFRQVKEELTKVTWPTRQQTIQKTALVIGTSLVVGIYIGALDFIFTTLSTMFIH